MSDFNYKFGLITEGVTDQTILKTILAGWTENKKLIVKELQPKPEESGGWTKVFQYCESLEFKGAFAYYDFIVIQIDTDFMRGDSVGEKYKIDLKNLDVKETVEAFREKIVELIGAEFYEEYSEKIIFAIAVNEIECWLLPAYFSGKKAKKDVNCVDTLNTVLPQKEGFYIDAKDDVYYRKLARNFRKKKDIDKYAKQQESFSLFLENLKSAVETVI